MIGTSDLHAYLYPYDYYRDRPDETVGLAKTAALISAASAEAAEYVAVRQRRLHPGLAARRLRGPRLQPTNPRFIPMIAAMNELGYAAGTLGNHEFNYGLDVLERRCAEPRLSVRQLQRLAPGRRVSISSPG